MKIGDLRSQKFTRTFQNGNYDAEFDDLLGYDRGLIFPARATQASYNNKPNNWRERNQLGLEKMKWWLQKATDKDQGLYCDWEQLTDNNEPIVWHEPILDDYWNNFEEEIYRRRRLDDIITDICEVEFVNVEITKKCLAALIAISSVTKSFEDIHFDNVNLCKEGIISLTKLVHFSSKLKILVIKHNRIDSMKSARCLSRSLKSHACIKHLAIIHCDIGSNLEILLAILHSDVKCICLDNNNIDSLGAVKIAEYLEGDPPIEEFSLDHNRLNDDDAILISQALKRNTNLRNLELEGNKFTSIGVRALLTCVFDSSSLTSISESNHTMERLRLFTRQKNGSLADCIDKLLKLNRAQKMMLALQDKDSLVQYLANVPVGLMPEVLAFPRWAADQPQYKHLNTVYSTMRWWNMYQV